MGCLNCSKTKQIVFSKWNLFLTFVMVKYNTKADPLNIKLEKMDTKKLLLLKNIIKCCFFVLIQITRSIAHHFHQHFFNKFRPFARPVVQVKHFRLVGILHSGFRIFRESFLGLAQFFRRLLEAFFFCQQSWSKAVGILLLWVAS